MTAESYDELVKALARRYTADADVYADHWQHMLAPLSAPLLDLLPLAEATRVLDMGCGPGTLATAIHQRGQSAWIVGVDHSSGMLRRAPALPYATWCLMDGRQLAFRARSFDTAVLAFSLFHYPDITAGLREVGRVLRPGGTVGTATFQTSPSFEAKRVWAESLTAVLPPDRSPAADLSAVDNVQQTDRPEKLEALLSAAGFRDVTTSSARHEHQWRPEDYLVICSKFGSSGEAFRALDEDAQGALMQTASDRFAGLAPDAFRFTPTVLYAVARRP